MEEEEGRGEGNHQIGGMFQLNRLWIKIKRIDIAMWVGQCTNILDLLFGRGAIVIL